MNETKLNMEEILRDKGNRKKLYPNDQVVISISKTPNLPQVADTYYNCGSCDDITPNVLSKSKIDKYHKETVIEYNK